jgi:hypothetical protein
VSSFDGDVTFVIGSSLRIRILNNQYIIPFATFDDQGHRVVNNTKKVLVMSHSGPNPATIGRWFFTGAVLMVDYGAGTFYLVAGQSVFEERPCRPLRERAVNLWLREPARTVLSAVLVAILVQGAGVYLGRTTPQSPPGPSWAE